MYQRVRGQNYKSAKVQALVKEIPEGQTLQANGKIQILESPRDPWQLVRWVCFVYVNWLVSFGYAFKTTQKKVPSKKPDPYSCRTSQVDPQVILSGEDKARKAINGGKSKGRKAAKGMPKRSSHSDNLTPTHPSWCF